MAHSFAHPPLAFATNEHEGSLGRSSRLVTVGSAAVVPSALHRGAEDGAPVLRFYNAGTGPVDAGIEVEAGRGTPERVDLLERPLADGGVVDGWRLRPWEIGTLRFRER
jgi:alpha-mannosidase